MEKAQSNNKVSVAARGENRGRDRSAIDGDSRQRTGTALKAANSFAGHATGKIGDGFAR